MTEPSVPRETSEEAKIGRRRLLKLVTATGGALAASSALPGKWTTPEVHASTVAPQSMVSPLLTISDLQVECLAPPDQFGLATYGVSFAYSDSAGEVDDTASLYARATPCGEIIFGGQSLNNLAPFAARNGTGFAGTILANIYTNACPDSVPAPEFCTILGVNRPFLRNSNELCETFPACEGERPI